MSAQREPGGFFMNISEHKRHITKQLEKCSDSPQRDAELLVMHVTQKTRSQLLVHYDEKLNDHAETLLQQLVARRLKREPMAYILGHQPFWTMDLLVTVDTLIPRPETECLVEWILANVRGSDSDCVSEIICIADLGVGSGAIAIALALENPSWKVDATDESYEALAVAKKNIEKYNVKNVSLYQGDWYDALPARKYDVIVSNPPYIAKQDPHLTQLTDEPTMALVSGEKGLDAIEKIAHQAKNFLKERGILIVEHGYDQGLLVVDIFKQAGFSQIINHYDLSDHMRFVTGVA